MAETRNYWDCKIFFSLCFDFFKKPDSFKRIQSAHHVLINQSFSWLQKVHLFLLHEFHLYLPDDKMHRAGMLQITFSCFILAQ